jgi:hypothetical protein
MIKVLFIQVWIWNIKTVEVILRRRKEKRENIGGDEHNQDTSYAFMEVLQLIYSNQNV